MPIDPRDVAFLSLALLVDYGRTYVQVKADRAEKIRAANEVLAEALARARGHAREPTSGHGSATGRGSANGQGPASDHGAARDQGHAGDHEATSKQGSASEASDREATSGQGPSSQASEQGPATDEQGPASEQGPATDEPGYASEQGPATDEQGHASGQGSVSDHQATGGQGFASEASDGEVASGQGASIEQGVTTETATIGQSPSGQGAASGQGTVGERPATSAGTSESDRTCVDVTGIDADVHISEGSFADATDAPSPWEVKAAPASAEPTAPVALSPDSPAVTLAPAAVPSSNPEPPRLADIIAGVLAPPRSPSRPNLPPPRLSFRAPAPRRDYALAQRLVFADAASRVTARALTASHTHLAVSRADNDNLRRDLAAHQAELAALRAENAALRAENLAHRHLEAEVDRLAQRVDTTAALVRTRVARRPPPTHATAALTPASLFAEPRDCLDLTVLHALEAPHPHAPHVPDAHAQAPPRPPPPPSLPTRAPPPRKRSRRPALASLALLSLLDTPPLAAT